MLCWSKETFPSPWPCTVSGFRCCVARQSQELMCVLKTTHYTLVGKIKKHLPCASSSTVFHSHAPPPIPPFILLSAFLGVIFALLLLLVLHLLVLDELSVLGDGLPHQEVSGCCTDPQGFLPCIPFLPGLCCKPCPSVYAETIPG